MTGVESGHPEIELRKSIVFYCKMSQQCQFWRVRVQSNQPVIMHLRFVFKLTYGASPAAW